MKKKKPVSQYVTPVLLCIFGGYVVYTLSGMLGINMQTIIEPDFVIAVLALTGIFLWARFG